MDPFATSRLLQLAARLSWGLDGACSVIVQVSWSFCLSKLRYLKVSLPDVTLKLTSHLLYANTVKVLWLDSFDIIQSNLIRKKVRALIKNRYDIAGGQSEKGLGKGYCGVCTLLKDVEHSHLFPQKEPL